MEARYFDPAIGMFRQVDPLWEKNFNIDPFIYVSDDPINYFDPDGKLKRNDRENLLSKRSNDNVNEDEYDLDGGVNLTDVEYIDDDGNKQVVKVKFVNTNSDNHTSNNKVSKKLKQTFDGAISEAAKKTKITEVTVTATTNGKHSSKSRHYVKNGAKAVDIGAVNGQSVKSIGNKNPVKALQEAFENQSGTHENFGPSMMKKEGKDFINDNLTLAKKSARLKVKEAHKNHIHWSVK